MQVPIALIARIRFVIGACAFAASVASIPGCAVDAMPPFLTLASNEDASVRAGSSGRFALAEGDMSCNPVGSLSVAGREGCVASTYKGDGASVSAIVPDGPHALLMLQLRQGTGPDIPSSIALVRATCADRWAGCRPDAQTIARWDSPKFGNLYVKSLAVSPDGRWAAVVPASHLLKMDGYSPRAPRGLRFSDQRHVGELILVDLSTGAQRRTQIEVLDAQPLAWSTDGRRVLSVRAETVDRLPSSLASGVTGDEGLPGQGIPVIESWDTASGAFGFIAIGRDPVWSPDGRSLLFEVSDGHYALRDLISATDREVELPGMAGRDGPIAFVGPRHVLYKALPTAGTNVEYTINNSPLVGPKQVLSIKIVDLDTRAYVTAYAPIDPRARVGYSNRP